MTTFLPIFRMAVKAAKLALHVHTPKVKACIGRCIRRVVQAHYKRDHVAHRHVIAGHSFELTGALAAWLRWEMLSASLLTAGAVLILSVALFASEGGNTDD
jgi:hypothetical protein